MGTFPQTSPDALLLFPPVDILFQCISRFKKSIPNNICDSEWLDIQQPGWCVLHGHHYHIIHICLRKNPLLPRGQGRYLQWPHISVVSVSEWSPIISLHHLSVSIHHLQGVKRGAGLLWRRRGRFLPPTI